MKRDAIQLALSQGVAAAIAGFDNCAKVAALGDNAQTFQRQKTS